MTLVHLALLTKKTNAAGLSGNGSAANSADREVRKGSAPGSAFNFDSVLARAAYSDETATQRIQRQKTSASMHIQRMNASLNGRTYATPNGAMARALSSAPIELQAIGAQFDAYDDRRH